MLTKFLNNYGYMILGGAMIIGFSAFKGAEAYAGKSLAPVTIYFHGDETSSSQVSSAFRWTTTPNGESCNDVDLMACSQVVDQTDLISSSRLDSTKIQLGATPTSGGNFIPSKAGGSSSTPFSPTNRG